MGSATPIALDHSVPPELPAARLEARGNRN
jgi:hypothetical protein